MKELLTTMEKFQNLSINIKSWCSQNQIQQPKIMSYTLERIQKLYNNYLEKYCSNKNPLTKNEKSSQPVWQQNELILFQWTVIAFSFCSRIYVKDFNRSQIQSLSLIYRNKPNYVLQYEVKCMLVKGKQIRNSWKVEQERLFSKIIKEMPENNKWNQIARQLYKVSDGLYFRQGKHCRDRWYSYVKNGKSIKDQDLKPDIELLQLLSGTKNKQFSLQNNFTPSQSRQFLIKRFEVLIQSVKAKFGHQISDQEAVALFLQQNNKKMSKRNNQLLLRKQRTQMQENSEQNLMISIEKGIIKQETDRKQVINLSQCQNDKSAMEDRVDQKINVKLAKPECNGLFQENVEQNFILFTYPTSILGNIYNAQYMPLQFYSQTPQIIQNNPSLSVDWLNFPNLYQSGELYFFS